MKDLIGPAIKIGLFTKPGKIVAVRSESNKITAWHSEEFDPVLYADRQLFASKINEILKNIASPKENLQIWYGIACQGKHVTRFTIPEVPEKQQASTALWYFQQNSNLDMTKMIFDYEVHEKTLEKNKAMQVISGMIMPREKKEELLKLFKHTEFNLFGVTPFWQSWYNIFKSQKLKKNSQTIAFLYTGLHESTLQVFKNGEEILSRHIKMGLSRFYDIYAKYSTGETSSLEFQDILSTIDLNERQALSGGGSLVNDTKMAVNQFWQKLNLTLDILAKQSGESVQTIYTCGSLAEYDFFLDFVSAQLPSGTELENISIPDSYISKKAGLPDDRDSDILNAITLSLCDNNNSKNFLFPTIEKTTFQSFLTKIKFSKIALFILAACASSYWFIYSSHISTLEANIITSRKNFKNFKEGAISKPLPPLEKVRQQLNLLSHSSKKATLLGLLDKILDIIPDKIKLTKMQIDKEYTKKVVAISISGIVTAKDDREFILNSFTRKLENIKDLDISGQIYQSTKQLEKQRVLSFNFNAELNQEKVKK